MSNLVHITLPYSSGIKPFVIDYQGRATNLRDLLFELAEEKSDLNKLLDDKGELQKFFGIWVNQKDSRFLQKLDTPIKNGDDVTILAAVTGK